MKTESYGRFLAIAGTITAVTVVAISIYLNPPAAVKAHSLDQERLSGLQQIDSAVKSYYHNHQILPASIEVLENQDGFSAHSSWRDPVTHHLYEYDVLSNKSYRLCADFSADSEKEEGQYFYEFRKHHKGHDCYQQAVD